jgi:hypothetical protein
LRKHERLKASRGRTARPGAKRVGIAELQRQHLELVLNLKTAKPLGLDMPETLLATADEVIK